jgi:hypothetical protein
MLTKKSFRERVAPAWGAHSTIGAAVRAAAEGSVVSVHPGTYRESVVLGRNVTLVAEKGPGTVRIVAARGPAITVHDGESVIRDLVVEGAAPGEAAILVRGGTPAVQGCEVTGGRIEVTGDAVATLKNCSVTGADGAAIRLTATSRTVLEDCAVRSAGGDGIAADDDARVECTGALVDGYPGEMQRFLASNAGLGSRFSRTLTFDDYRSDELVRIVTFHADRYEYQCPPDTVEALHRFFEELPRGERFGNGRTARQVFQLMTERHAQRIADDLTAVGSGDLTTLLPVDLPPAEAV